MSKQRCGTCRFFQDAPLAGSGWCHHPLRRTTSDLLLMVRKNELACRDGWAHSLWEPGVWEEQGEAETEPEILYAGKPMAPANEREIASLMIASAPRPADEAAEDRVLSEIGLPPGEDADPPYPRIDRTLSSRSAIVRARENIRERRRVEPRVGAVAAESTADDEQEPTPRASRLAAARDGEPASPIEASDPGAGTRHRVDPADGRVATVGGGSEWYAVDGYASSLEDDAFETDPGVFDREFADDPVEVEHPATGRSVARGLFGGFGRFLTDVYGRTARPAQAESRADEGGCDQFDDDRAEDVERADVVAHSVRTDLVWAGDPEAEFDTMVQRLGPDPDLAGGCERGQPIGSDRGTVSAPRDAAGIAPTPADASVPVSAADDGTRWGVFDLDRDLAGALVVPSPDLAPELPRVCRTCRDFRPAEQGGRGWCTNRWAFTHRRVVDGEDAAPCESSFGSWWLPVDDAWMAAGDVSEHGRPTPLLDHWLPGHREEERQRRGT